MLETFTFFGPMKYSIKDDETDEITLGLSIVYIEGLQDIRISKSIGYISMKIGFDSADPDEMPHYCLPPIRLGFLTI